MKKKLILLICLAMFVAATGIANALPFEVIHDYSWDGTYQGATFVSLWAGPPNTSFTDNFAFPNVDPPASSINTAYVSIRHVGNLSGPLNPEVWILSGNNEYFIGQLSLSGSPLFLSPWVTDTYPLSDPLISAITSSVPWTLALKLTETTTLPDILWVDKASFGGNYEPVPEPATMLLLGSGLVGPLWLRRKLRR